jgi:hypothetical protein
LLLKNGFVAISPTASPAAAAHSALCQSVAANEVNALPLSSAAPLPLLFLLVLLLLLLLAAAAEC